MHTIKMTAEDQRRLHNLATIGTVTHIDADNALMRLSVGDNETDWVNIPAVAAGQVRVWRCPSIGEQYLLISPSGDLANAIPVMSLYSDANPSPSSNPDEIRIRYNDTDFCSINTSDSNIVLHLSDMTAEAKTSITLDTPDTTLTGDLKVHGNIDCDNTIAAKTEVKAAGIKLTSHGHTNVENGRGTSGKPV